MATTPKNPAKDRWLLTADSKPDYQKTRSVREAKETDEATGGWVNPPGKQAAYEITASLNPVAEDTAYCFRIEGVAFQPFSPADIDFILTGLQALSVVDGNHFEAIWYHVQAAEGRTLFLPPAMIVPLFRIIGDLLDTKRATRIAYRNQRDNDIAPQDSPFDDSYPVEAE